MLIEVIIKQYLDEHLDAPSFFDYPTNPPNRFVFLPFKNLSFNNDKYQILLDICVVFVPNL